MQRRIVLPSQITYQPLKIANAPLPIPQQQPQQQGIKRIDSYDLSETLGKGSYSVVYKGFENGTGMPVAIKVMNLQSLKNNYVNQLVLSEITLMKSFQHKNIVKLYEVIQTKNNLYIILEYCNQGKILKNNQCVGDLRQLLEEKKTISEKKSMHILYEVIQGYQDILNHSIIHRDLKPENILIHNGICKIADFGFAKAISRSVPVGTPLYCSPQCMAETYYTVKTDIWSLGIMYYEMLYGQTPWPCQNYEELKQKMKQHPYIRYSNNIAISEESYEFIKNSLQFEESKRMSWEQAINSSLMSKCREVENINQKKSNQNFIEKEPIQEEHQIKYQQMLREQFKQSQKKIIENGHISPNCENLEEQLQINTRPKSGDEIKKLYFFQYLINKRAKDQITFNLSTNLSQNMEQIKQVKTYNIVNNLELSNEFHQNNEIILFNLNYINTLNLIKNLADAITFSSLNLSQQKLQFIILKHLMIKLLPLKNLQKNASEELNTLNLKNIIKYIKSETFAIHYKTILNYFNQIEIQYESLEKNLKLIESQLFKDTIFIGLYQLQLIDSLEFYEQLLEFLANSIRQLNHHINLEIQTMFTQNKLQQDNDLELMAKDQENCILLLAFLIKYYKIVKVNCANFNDILKLKNKVNFSQILVEINVNVDIEYYINLRKIIYDLNI